MTNILALLNIIQCMLIIGLCTILVLNVRTMKKMRELIISTTEKFLVRVMYLGPSGEIIHSEMMAYDTEKNGSLSVTHKICDGQAVNVQIIKVPGI